MVLDNYENFIKRILDKLDKLGIDVSNLNMDHIGYQASSNEDYDKLVPEFDAIGKRVSELDKDIQVKFHLTPVLEIVKQSEKY